MPVTIQLPKKLHLSWKVIVDGEQYNRINFFDERNPYERYYNLGYYCENSDSGVAVYRYGARIGTILDNFEDKLEAYFKLEYDAIEFAKQANGVKI